MRITEKGINSALLLVKSELVKAIGKFGLMHSTHEGYALLKEEVDELWDAVKSNHDTAFLTAEAVQVAAMAVSFILTINQPYFKRQPGPGAGLS